MVNEFVYCPRLFHLEWVQGRFATSDDVEEGLYVHRVVDEPTPLPEASPELLAGRRARAVRLSSAEVGVTAVIDLVEVGDGGAVVPVDYKKGGPGPGGAPRDTDRVQSVLQALLLREAGYAVPHAEVWYAETRRRVEVRVDDSAVAEVTDILRRLWSVAAEDAPPPPLVDSPKCPRCSLVGICLPDEVNALRSRIGLRTRRGVMAPDPDSRPVYVQEQGSVVGVRRGRLEVHAAGELLASYRLLDVQQVCCQGNVTVTSQAMREFFAREIPVAWFSYGGWFQGIAHGLPGKYVDLRRSQYTAPGQVATRVAAEMVRAKVTNQRVLLRRNARVDVATAVDQLKALAGQAGGTQGVPSLLGVEGTAARLYFQSFPLMLNPDARLDWTGFAANGRSRRPPPDPVNALLSFVYALLMKDITAALVQIGLDPYLGVYHRPRHGRPALSLDLAEEFRPLIADSTVLQVINNNEVANRHFTISAGGCQLDADGRKTVISAYERRMSSSIKHPVFGYKVTYRRALDVQGRLLAAHLVGDVPEYVAFTTR